MLQWTSQSSAHGHSFHRRVLPLLTFLYWRRVYFALLLCGHTFVWSSYPIDAAQLRIRKELLIQQTDRALATVSGDFEHVTDIAEKGECQIKASVRAKEINVAIVGQFINACSTKLDPNEIRVLSQNGTIPISGVFRIWFPHAARIDDIFSEEFELEPYRDPSPKHAIELHPVVHAADRSFFDTVRAMEKADFKADGVEILSRLLKRKITIEQYESDDGKEFVAIESGGALPNYFHLKAILRSKPIPTEDGLMASIDILDRHRTIATAIRLFSIEGTKVHRALQSMKKNSEFSFWGVTRLDGKKLLKALDDDAGYHIPIPFEFVLLDIHR